MGAALRRTAFSPNIKERRDYSCALFDAAGEVLAMGDHMPVHLGSMPMSVRAAIDELALAPGDVAMLNDPFRGGTHLPDITVVAPVFVAAGKARASRGRAGAHSKRDWAQACGSGFLRRGARASRRHRRNLCRLDGTVPRDLPGRLSHSAGEDRARRRSRSRRAGAAAEQRPHAGRARRRPARATGRLSHRHRAPAGAVRALRIGARAARRPRPARLLRADDAGVSRDRSAGLVCGGRFSGRRRRERRSRSALPCDHVPARQREDASR